MRRAPTSAAVAAASLLLGVLTVGCGAEDIAYEPKPAHTGTKPSLPPVPTLPNKKKMEGDAYTVWGASHDLRSRVHHDDFKDKEISIVGFIVDVNYDDAPECAVHRMGKADGPDCVAPVPTFWIADSQGEKDEKISVMGWAENFAQVYSMMEALEKDEEASMTLPRLQVPVPTPLPAVGGKVKVTGRYATTYTGATAGTASNPKWGILTYQKLVYLEKPPEAAAFPKKEK